MHEFNSQKIKEILLQLKVCVINIEVLIDILNSSSMFGSFVKVLVPFNGMLRVHIKSLQDNIPEDKKHEFKYGNLLD